MSNPPFAKWIYDLALEIVHCESQGLTIDLKAIHALIPNGVKLVAQGILDYHQLQSAECAAAECAAAVGATVTAAPAEADQWAAVRNVVPLQQAAANGQLSQNAGA